MHGERLEFAGAQVGLFVALVATAIALIAATCSAEDFYRWVDQRGGVHYSNAPSEVPTGTMATRVSMKEEATSSGGVARQPGTEAEGETEEAAAGRHDVEAGVPSPPTVAGQKKTQQTSAEVSLARYDLRRELTDAEAQLADVERKLSELAAVRMQHANRPHPSVGGLRAVGAAEARSPEEEALEERRKGLEKQIEDIRGRLAALPTR